MQRAALLVLTCAWNVACRGADAPPAPAATAPPAPAYPLALAFVWSSEDAWISDCEDDCDCCDEHMWHVLGPAIDRAQLARHALPGSRAIVVSYDVGGRVDVELSLDRLDATAFTRHRNRVGRDLVEGVSVALDALTRTDAAHRVLVLIGDGEDTNSDTAPTELARLRERAAGAHIAIVALVRTGLLSDGHLVIGSLTDRVVHVSDVASLATALLQACSS